MTINNFISKINWRLFAIHLIATFFFILAARQFTVLNDMEVVVSAEKYGFPEAWEYLVEQDEFGVRFSNYTLWMAFAPLIGISISFTISVLIAIRQKVFWINPVLVLFAALFFNKLGLFDNELVDVVFFSFGRLFENIGLQYRFLANGTLLVLIALFLFFSKRLRDFTLNKRTRVN